MLKSRSTQLIEPYGNRIVPFETSPQEQEELKHRASQLPSVQISNRSVCDLELLATGAFNPLTRFMGSADHHRVVQEMRLSNGVLFPIPIRLHVDPFNELELDKEIALRGPQNEVLAILRVEEIYPWDLQEEATLVYGTSDTRHPLVSEMSQWGALCLSGALTIVTLPKHYDFLPIRYTPTEARKKLEQLGYSDVVAFQTRNPMHRSHEETTKRAMGIVGGALLIHPTVGVTRAADINYFTRVRCVQVLTRKYYDSSRVVLGVLPLAMRFAGPREALWHMIIRRNYGANHFIIGRDHASPGVDSQGKPFYPPYAAQELAGKHKEEIGVQPLTFQEFVCLADEERYEEIDKIPKGKSYLSISGTEIRESYLGAGKMLPSWFTRPEVARILMESYPPKYRQGFCLWFTGLPCAGKSTIAEILLIRLFEKGRRVSLLDGDIVRTHLSKGLGFSREDRDANILRIGFVASEIARHNGCVITAAVSPYRSTRDQVRSLFSNGNFVEIFVDTPQDVCETRDAKGMYGKARRGEIKGFTGIDDPYERPLNPEIHIDGANLPPEKSATLIVEYLEERGYLAEREHLEL